MKITAVTCGVPGTEGRWEVRYRDMSQPQCLNSKEATTETVPVDTVPSQLCDESSAPADSSARPETWDGDTWVGDLRTPNLQDPTPAEWQMQSLPRNREPAVTSPEAASRP